MNSVKFKKYHWSTAYYYSISKKNWLSDLSKDPRSPFYLILAEGWEIELDLLIAVIAVNFIVALR